MSRHRSGRHTNGLPFSSAFGVRAAAVLTLALGVLGGLSVTNGGASAPGGGFDSEAARKADQTEYQLLKADYAARQKANLIVLAEQKAKDEAERKAAEERAKAAEEAKRSAARNSTPNFGPIPESCNEYSGNRAIGCALMLEAGYGLDQMTCLEKLWTKESGWNENSHNSSSGAHGIPQALPGSKMAAYGDDWATNPATQIKWGLSYIKGRYSTPCGAWQHFLDTNWY